MDNETTNNILCQRILDLIPENPEILDIESPWDLFKIKQFKSDDLNITLSYAMRSLSKAKKLYRTKKEGNHVKTN